MITEDQKNKRRKNTSGFLFLFYFILFLNATVTLEPVLTRSYICTTFPKLYKTS